MENTITLKVNTIQLLLSLAFQIWIIVFPIIIIRKLNYLTALFHEQLGKDQETS